jgi:lipoate-protein ligase A
MTTLEAVLGRRPSFDETVAALTEGFREAHGVTVVPGGLEPDEEASMRALVADKYGTDRWTRSGRVPIAARALS